MHHNSHEEEEETIPRRVPPQGLTDPKKETEKQLGEYVFRSQSHFSFSFRVVNSPAFIAFLDKKRKEQRFRNFRYKFALIVLVALLIGSFLHIQFQNDELVITKQKTIHHVHDQTMAQKRISIVTDDNSQLVARLEELENLLKKTELIKEENERLKEIQKELVRKEVLRDQLRIPKIEKEM